MEWSLYLAIVLSVSILLFITASQFILVYRRYFKSYNEEIISFLTSKNLCYDSSYNPSKLDWQKSPFQKPPDFKVGFSFIRINGVNIDWSKEKYKIIETIEGQMFWLEIETTYFKKPILNFRPSKKITKQK